MDRREQRIWGAAQRVDRDRRSGEVLWLARTDDGAVDVTYGDPRRPFFIASATKLYVSAILAQLRGEGLVDWDAPIAGYLPDLDLSGLVVVEGTDRSSVMTVREVMAHTSGLADYFEGRRVDGPTTFERAIAADLGWTVRDVIAWTKPMEPGTPGRGRYSDTRYQLLGALIERVGRGSFADAVRTRIAEPLGLRGTACFGASDIDRYDAIAVLRYGDVDLRIPRAMASVQADGGIVSTLEDGAAFLDAFFGGRLFDAALLGEMGADWHRIFAPLEYGTGLMRFRLPRIMTGLRRVSPFIGHSGASGTVMFRCPELGLTVVGTVNQAKHRSMPYRLLVRTAVDVRRG